MTLKTELSTFRQRLSDFASHFEDGAGDSETRRPSARKTRTGASAFSGLRDLFTQGATREDFRDLVRRDARDAWRFYMRGIDLESLRALPWHRRYPVMCWKVFVSLANRMSPARRIAFAGATFVFLLAWIQLLVFAAGASDDSYFSWAVWLFIAFATLFLLLLIELRDKLDLKGDLEIAREIQFGLVPPGPYFRNAMGIHCYMRPANTVGGDYYDIIELEDNRIGLVVGDVAGKGMPAALLMALLQGSLRTLLAAGHRGADLVAKLNVYLCSNIPSNSLVTLFYAELDTVDGDLHYVNAGHNAPFMIRAGQVIERLPATALVLGIDPNSVFETGVTRIGPRDRLILFTDGITEAFNRQEEEYGEERLVAFLRGHAAGDPVSVIRELIDELLEFCGAERIRDDITLMLVVREPEATKPAAAGGAGVSTQPA